jgi:probable HAF family extracellular repeat protein
MSDLGTLGGDFSEGLGINDSGQVVGYSLTTVEGDQHAFVYSGGTMTDLNDLIAPGSGWTLALSTGINDSGQIVGIGRISGQSHGFLLTLIAPEPGSLALLGMITLPLVGRLRRRKQ